MRNFYFSGSSYTCLFCNIDQLNGESCCQPEEAIFVRTVREFAGLCLEAVGSSESPAPETNKVVTPEFILEAMSSPHERPYSGYLKKAWVDLDCKEHYPCKQDPATKGERMGYL